MRLIATLLIFLASFSLAGQNVIYVDQDATGIADGSSWENAFTDLQSALSASFNGDEIWMAEGIYQPSTTDPNAQYSTSVHASILGGFIGAETSKSERDWQTHPTILSGEIGGPGPSDNIGRVLGCSGGTGSWQISGIIFEDFIPPGSLIINTNSTTHEFGLRNCVFRNINNGDFAQLLYTQYASLSMVNCLTYNVDLWNFMSLAIGSTGDIRNCTFTDYACVASPFVRAGSTEISMVNSIVTENLTSGTQYQSQFAYIYNSLHVPDVHPAYLVDSANVFDFDPLFLDALANNYHLSVGSPAVDAGANAPVNTSLDLNRQDRIQGTKVDFGCFEGAKDGMGCTDIAACNYDSSASIDDGSCNLPGCLDPVACNYDPTAECNSYTCEYDGCTHPDACNYDAAALCDDGSCVFPGCTDADACNYDPTAGCDDGSCIGFGCTDPAAINYDENAGCDDGSCCVGNQVIITMDPDAIFGGSNVAYVIQLIDGSGDVYSGNNGYSVNDPDTLCLPTGCYSVTFTTDATYLDWSLEALSASGTQLFNGPGSDQFDLALGTELGCTDPTACNYNDLAGCDDGSCVYPGCTDTAACNYQSFAGCDDGSCTYPGCLDPTACNYVVDAGCGDTCTYPGCMDEDACNYDAGAACDDGSCEFPGCTDPAAVNYDDTAGCDDGNCCTQNAIVVTLEPEAIFGGNAISYTISFQSTGSVVGSGSNASSNNLIHHYCLPSNCYTLNITAESSFGDWEVLIITESGTQPLSGSGSYSTNLTIGGVIGCTEETACNYNPNAVCDNGSCIDSGCTDFTACNYTPGVGCDDGSCVYPGCINPSACNYDPDAGCSAACVYPGCTDPAACNYNANAGCDNGSCTYPGCTISAACNYDPNAGCNDGSCTYPGCTDETACNYSAFYGCDNGSCVYPGCNNPTACNYEPDAGCDDGSCLLPGCMDNTACNYDASAGCEDGSCLYPGCDDPEACNYDSEATCGDDSCVYPGCTYSIACNYDPNAGCDDGSCEFPGCTDPLSCNYDPAVLCDDGSCILPGCEDENACNYNPDAACLSFDTCEYNSCNDCPGDYDGSGDINSTDLLYMLGAFATNCGFPYCNGDLTGEGDIDTTDLLILLGVFGTACD